MLEGDYQWTVEVPAFTPDGFDLDTTVPISMRIEASPTPSGADVVLVLEENLLYERHAVLHGSKLLLEDVPFFVGASAADSTGINATVLDLDGDGVGDRYATRLSGPGIWLDEHLWQFEPHHRGFRAWQSRDLDVDLSIEEGQMDISWGEEGALGCS